MEPRNRLMIRRPLQHLVRPGRARPHVEDPLPDHGQPHLCASRAFAAARADRRRAAVGAACRRRVTATDGAAPPSRPNAPATFGAAEAERPSSAAAESTY